MDEAEEAAGGVVVASGNAAAVLQAVDAAFDAVAEGIERPLDAVLDAPVALGRDLRLPAAVTYIPADGITVVATVGKMPGSLSRSSISTP